MRSKGGGQVIVTVGVSFVKRKSTAAVPGGLNIGLTRTQQSFAQMTISKSNTVFEELQGEQVQLRLVERI